MYVHTRVNATAEDTNLSTLILKRSIAPIPRREICVLRDFHNEQEHIELFSMPTGYNYL